MSTLAPLVDVYDNSSYEPATTTKGMVDNVSYHTINAIFGATCFCLNIPLFFIFVCSKYLRTRFQVLIALCLADAANCLAIFTMGLNRVNLYTSVLETHLIPIRNSWMCALEPWLWLRGIGDLWPPILQLFMGFERATAVYAPISYMVFSKNRVKIIIIPSVIFVVVSLIVGFSLAYTHRADKAIYYCGRKEAFSDEYGLFIYGTNIICYVVGLFLNVVALGKVSMSMTDNDKNQLRRIRYTLAISLLSTILVSIPNTISIFSATVGNLADAIKKPSTYFTCVNSGINIFVYIILNNEFRHHMLVLMRLREPSGESSSMFMTRTAVSTRT